MTPLIIFYFSLLLLFYIFIAYPLIIYFLGRQIIRKPDTLNKVELTVSVLLVVCNEEKNIYKKIKNLLNLEYKNNDFDIYVVDDASDDDTVKIIKEINSDRIRLIQLDKRSGKAAGLNEGVSKISTDLIFLTDSRQVIDKHALKYLSEWFFDTNVAAISGELLFLEDEANDFSKGMDGYWRYEKQIRKSEARYKGVPGVTGAIYMLRRELYRQIPVDTILDDVLIPMNCASHGYYIGFDERAKAWDIPSTVVARERKRKIRTISGNYQLLFRNPKWIMPFYHPLWFEFLSHKILRLVAPLLMAINYYCALLLSMNGFTIASMYLLLFTLFILSYPLSLMAPKINSNTLIRLSSSFISLNWFNFLALLDYLFSKKKTSWKSTIDLDS